MIVRLCRDTRGATAVEYGLIAALIVLGMLGGLISFADQSNKTWNNISTAVSKG
jgi:pilus assembly protein Flp/PilA